MQTLWQDVRYAVRLLRKKPSFTIIAVLTLACGIGANTAIFSAADALFWQAMPYPDANRLVYLSSSFPNNTQGGDDLSYAAFADWQAQSQSFDKMAVYQDWVAVNLTGREEAVRLTANFITADYLALFNATTALGRTFTPEEMQVPASSPYIVISYDCWQTIFGGDANIIGRQLEINQTPITIIGVMQKGFRDLDDLSRSPIDGWMPLGLTQPLLAQSFDTRAARAFGGVARLKPGVDIAAAKAEADTIALRLAEAYPASEKGFGLYVESLRDRFFGRLYHPMALLFIASGFVLLIGCANIANLLLARAVGRRKEMAVRAALGATRRRLLSQLVVECLVLSLMAGGLGLLFAQWATYGLNSWEALRLPAFVEIRINGWALAVSFGLSLLTGLICGLVPAWESARPDIREVLNQAGKQSAALERHASRRLLVIGEVALSVILLVGTGLIVKSVYKLTEIGLGFDTENLLTVRMDLNAARYAPTEARVQFARSLVEQAEAIPGVESATIWGPAPLGRATWVMFAAPEGKPINGQADWKTMWRHSTNPGGLQNLGLPILRGRDFSWQDKADTPLVAIVSTSVAEQFWPDQDPIGKRLMRQTANGILAITVIGVTTDARHRTRYLPSQGANWAFQPQLDVYLPYAQLPNSQLVVALRLHNENTNVMAAFRDLVRSLDRDMTVYEAMTVNERLRQQSETPQAIATLMTIYGSVALFLASLGVYGILAHAVAQRTQEIGIRLALGAQPRDIFKLVIGQGLRLTTAGLALGLLSAFWLTRFFSHLLFGISATDPMTFVGVALVLNAIAFLACYAPARRATKVDPMVALRYE